MCLAVKPIHYPESDGKPMAETDVHRDEMVYFIEALRAWFRGQEVYVSGNILLYYREGDAKKCVSPDCLVAFGRPSGQRRIYKTWVEGKVPDVVIEVTSSSTRREDQVTKWRLYAELGVRELWLVDPLGDYLGAPVRGFRLQEGSWVEVPIQNGRGRSTALQLDFCAIHQTVRLFDPTTGEYLPSPPELTERLEERSQQLGRVTLELGQTTQQLDLTAQQLDLTAQQLDLTAQQLDLTAQQLDLTSQALRAQEEANAALRAELDRLRAAQGGTGQVD